jgi:glycosyltransferase involved in cell wall biosynthesis
MANYNMAAYVEEAIGSLRAQTIDDIEIVVVDDGSTDASWGIIQAVAAADPRIRAIRQANSGQARAKNVGIAASRGQFVGFCDADDTWLPHKLEVQLRAFDSDDVGLVYTDLYTMDREGTVTGKSNISPVEGWVLQSLFVRNFVPFGTALVRRRALDECGRFDEAYRMGIDWELWLRIARRYRFRHVREWTARYRAWEGQMSKDWQGRYRWAFRIMEDFLNRFPTDVEQSVARKAFSYTYFNRGMYRAELAGEWGGGLADVARGLRYRPFDPMGWRVFAKVLTLGVPHGRRSGPSVC